jgi:flagellar basal body P-ring formation protein FlgA
MTRSPLRYRLARGAVAAVLLAAAVPAAAAPLPPIETAAAIRAAIATALQPRLDGIKDASAEIGAVDPRLRLPACPSLAVTVPETGTAAVTAKVACASPDWTLYVPIRLHAFVEAVTAATNLAPNTKLSADELSRGRVDLMSFTGRPVTEPTQAEGKTLRVGVLAGAPILTTYLEQPVVVHRGQKVLVTLTDGTMVVRNTAVALENGRIGDMISLENPASRRIVHATVAADGTVEMRF